MSLRSIKTFTPNFSVFLESVSHNENIHFFSESFHLNLSDRLHPFTVLINPTAVFTHVYDPIHYHTTVSELQELHSCSFIVTNTFPLENVQGGRSSLYMYSESRQNGQERSATLRWSQWFLFDNIICLQRIHSRYVLLLYCIATIGPLKCCCLVVPQIILGWLDPRGYR